MPETALCPVCDAAVVRRGSRSWIDVEATNAALIDLVRRGEMRVLRGDVPLEDMIALAESELRYTVVSFLACHRCQNTKFWGLCIRGEPVYRTCRPRWLAQAAAPSAGDSDV
ncbi:MAG: hypothetical protein QM607_04165 [Microbacterium sp.]